MGLLLSKCPMLTSYLGVCVRVCACVCVCVCVCVYTVFVNDSSDQNSNENTLLNIAVLISIHYRDADALSYRSINKTIHYHTHDTSWVCHKQIPLYLQYLPVTQYCESVNTPLISCTIVQAHVTCTYVCICMDV